MHPPSWVVVLLSYAVSWQLFPLLSRSGLLPVCSDRPSRMKGNVGTKQTFIYLYQRNVTGDVTAQVHLLSMAQSFTAVGHVYAKYLKTKIVKLIR